MVYALSVLLLVAILAFAAELVADTAAADLALKKWQSNPRDRFFFPVWRARRR
jgi:hypothetical protein